MNPIAELLISFFILVSGVFGLVGSYGLIKLRDTMQRLHAPTKATTLGVGGVLRQRDLPKTGRDYGWSVYDDPPNQPPGS